MEPGLSSPQGETVPILYHVSRDHDGILDFHPYPAVMRTAPQPHCGGIIGGQMESEVSHHCLSNEATPSPHGVIEAMWGAVSRHCCSSQPGWTEWRPSGELALQSLSSNKEVLQPLGARRGQVGNQDFHVHLAVTREHSLSPPEQCQRKPKNKI